MSYECFILYLVTSHLGQYPACTAISVSTTISARSTVTHIVRSTRRVVCRTMFSLSLSSCCSVLVPRIRICLTFVLSTNRQTRRTSYVSTIRDVEITVENIDSESDMHSLLYSSIPSASRRYFGILVQGTVKQTSRAERSTKL